MEDIVTSSPDQTDDRLLTGYEIFLKVGLAFGIAVININILELFVLKCLKKKLRIYEMFLFSLLCSDFLFGMTFTLIAASKIFRWSLFPDEESMYVVTRSLNILFLLISIFHLNAIALDRLLAICKPIKHNVAVTKPRVRIFLGFL